MEVEAISGACMLVRRAALDDVGGLDEGYFLHCEDLDWCHRFRQAGWRVLFVPGVRVVHDKGVSSRARPVFVQWHLHRGMVRYYRKFLRDEYPSPLHRPGGGRGLGALRRPGRLAMGAQRAIASLRRRIARRGDVGAGA